MNDASSSDILSYDQYAEIEKAGLTSPHIVEIARGGQSLLFYGSEHVNDPEHPQFQDIEDRWKTFINNAARPIALVEGRFDEVSEDDTSDKIQAITDGGEAQFVVYLARKYDIEVASPEPDRLWEANQLAEEFGRDKVVFYYFMRQIAWWSGLTEKPDMKTEATKMLELMERSYDWEDVDFSIERMLDIHQELFAKPLDWDDSQWTYDLTTPTPLDYVTNELARRSGELRDDYIFHQIADYWKAGRSPFVVFGSSHVIRLEPALRKLLA
jgi:hypothetical protein